jgi:hypothetical protein
MVLMAFADDRSLEAFYPLNVVQTGVDASAKLRAQPLPPATPVSFGEA